MLYLQIINFCDLCKSEFSVYDLNLTLGQCDILNINSIFTINYAGMCEIFFYCHMSYIFLSINKYFGYVLLTNESFHWTVSWWRLTIRPLYSHCECLSYNRKKHWKSGTETVNFKAVQCSFLVQALAHFSLLISIIFIRVNEIQGPTLELSLILFFSVLGLILHFPLTQKNIA